MLAIPDLDRGRCEFPNLTAIVVEVHDGGLYKLGCKTGILDSFYTRNQFSPTQESLRRVWEGDKASSDALVLGNASIRDVSASKRTESVILDATTEGLAIIWIRST